MKANELSCKDLMVGDWVIFHDSGYASDGTTWKEDRVCQIDAIDVDVRVKWYDEDGYKEDWPHVSTFCLSPIPLTPEILEKNGFRIIFEGELHVSYFQDIESFHIEVKVDKIGIYQKLSMLNGLGDGVTIVECKYVHQLQNALRLCGIDKNIEL